MKSEEPSPPRWAEAQLRSLLRPVDRESISGDLLEEYRAVRRPSLGALRANIWYVRHVLSMLWHLIRPCALVLLGTNVLRVLLGVLGRMVRKSARDTMLALMARILVVRQSCASPWRLLVRRADLFVGRSPRLPTDASYQDGDASRWGNQFRRIHDSFHGNSDQNPGPASRTILQAVHLCHSRDVDAYRVGLWCSRGRHRRHHRQVDCARGSAKFGFPEDETHRGAMTVRTA